MKTAEETISDSGIYFFPKLSMYTFEQASTLMESYAAERVKDELTSFLDFLLKNGYCDVDVYAEPPSAIDRYMHPELNK